MFDLFNKKLNILVLGCNGMLGYEVYNNLKNDSLRSNSLVKSVYGVDIADRIDISEEHALDTWFDGKIHFDYCINCIAYTDTGKAQTDKNGYSNDYKLNALAPKYIAQTCKQRGIKLIHISTDYVFSYDCDIMNPGIRKELKCFEPDSEPYPCNVYGEHKLLGEEFIKNVFGPASKDYAILRTSWLYGEHNCKSFIHKFMKNVVRCFKENKPVEVTSNEVSVPTSCGYLYKCITTVISENMHGILHAVPHSNGISRFEFAEQILLYFKNSKIERQVKRENDTMTSFDKLSECKLIPVERNSYWPVFSAMKQTAEFPSIDWREDLEIFMRIHKNSILDFAVKNT